MQPFDFDEWAALAKTDPEAFAQRRAAAVEDLIASAPLERQHRLRCLQWCIDMERQRCSNPMHACIHFFNKMWDSVYGERGLLNALMMQNTNARTVISGEQNALSNSGQSSSLFPRATASATILPFSRPDTLM